ncbi:hypothetical protein J2754_002991 [Halarchaeum solikamskense]|uniref:hypothetical protein n=1 Tax=Halarchaeum nitratireducens TaxID=489913 RepID=UPI001B3B195C|nr:hypothetical protein [Halarchaeum solikamskense]MBP2252645.1 hypothetical protein [Halarchaeum solikamskense]
MSSGDGTLELDVGDGVPIDFERLSLIAERLGDATRSAIDESSPTAPDRLVCVFEPALYPVRVGEARRTPRRS